MTRGICKRGETMQLIRSDEKSSVSRTARFLQQAQELALKAFFLRRRK